MLRRYGPIVTLVLLAPIVAELLAGTVPLWQAGNLVFSIPIYGGGALLIREVVRRRRRGWPSIILLGAAYGVVEEGLALQSLFSPMLYGVADWGPQLLGINLTYVEVVIPLHAVWSATVPILLTELAFPDRRTEPWLGRVGFIVTGVVYLLGVGIIALGARTQLDPDFVAPAPLLELSVVVVVALVVLALVVIPPDVQRAPRPGQAPSPWMALVVGTIGSVAFLGLLIPLGSAERPAFTHGDLVLLPMVSALVVGIVVAVLVWRWAAMAGWSDRHLLALAGGSLIGHTLIFALTPHTLAERLSLLGLDGMVVLLLAALDRAVAKRPGTDEARAGQAIRATGVG